MRYGDIASPNAWLTKICVALAKLRRVGMTIYSVISLTIAQLQLRSNPVPRKKLELYSDEDKIISKWILSDVFSRFF